MLLYRFVFVFNASFGRKPLFAVWSQLSELSNTLEQEQYWG